MFGRFLLCILMCLAYSQLIPNAYSQDKLKKVALLSAMAIIIWTETFLIRVICWQLKRMCGLWRASSGTYHSTK